MQKRFLVVVCLLASLLMQAPLAGMADAVADTDQAHELAQSIVEGKRPPLSAAELGALSERDKQKLAIALGQCRQVEDHHFTDNEDELKQNDQRTQSPTRSMLSENDLPVLTRDKKNFISYFGPLAQRVGRQYDLYPSVIIAQAILESSWGQSTLYRQYHNPLGVKGKGVCMPTLEQTGDQIQALCASFRAYPNIEAALDDYGHIMQSDLYHGAHRSQTKNYQEVTNYLRGRYATDNNYDQKLNLLIKHYHLERFDHDDKEKGPDHRPLPIHQHEAEYQVKKQPVSATHSQPVQWQWPIIGGAGSLGILGLIRRLIK